MTDVFHTLTVASVRRLAGDALEIVFAVPDAAARFFAYTPGQHMAVRATIGGAVQQRTYSICSGSNGPLRIGIKRIPAGVFSTWANASITPGATLEVATPQGRFTLPKTDGAARHLLMIAGGAGITPILGMTIEALETESSTRVTLLYGTRTLATAMFLDDLEDLKDRFPSRLDVVHVLSGNGQSESDLLQGRLTGDKLTAIAARRIEVGTVTRAFLCGPGSFIKETRNALFDLGLARDAVHHEFFASRTSGPMPASNPITAPASLVAAPAAGGVEAVAILDGKRHTFTIEPGQHVLEAALIAGIKAPYSCTGGMCSTCRARIVDGHATMAVNYSLEPWEIERGFTLTCQAVPTSPSLVIDYDAM